MSSNKKWQKILKRKIRKSMRSAARRRGTKKRFYQDCVQFIKKQRGFILPHETSYAHIARLLEGFANSAVVGTDYQRCLEAASKLGIGLPQLFTVRNGVVTRASIPVHERRDRFYSSLPWKKLRYATLVKYGARCQACGATGADAEIRVDHIKPVSKYWSLRLSPDNLQVLCNDCNWGKLNLDQTDWRNSNKPKRRIRLRLEP